MPNRDSKEHSPDAKYEDVAQEIDLTTTMAEENRRGGWSKVNSPVGGKPEDTSTFGSSGGN